MINYMGWGFMGLFMGIVWLVFIIWIISWFFRSLPHSRTYYHRDFWSRWDHDDEAVEILRERYAKGEITKEQFDKMMEDLKR